MLAESGRIGRAINALLNPARMVIMVRPLTQWDAERRLRLLLKDAFETAGIEIAFPRQVVYLR